MKDLALDSTPRMEEAEARSRHQSLMKGFEDLQKEVDALRSQLDAAKQRKLILTAEVRFLRRRHKCLVEANRGRSASAQEQPSGAEEASLAPNFSPLPQLPDLNEGGDSDNERGTSSSTLKLFGKVLRPRSSGLPKRRLHKLFGRQFMA